MHAGVACSCGTDPPECGAPPPGGTGMTFHSLRCLICLADISIIPSEERYDLPLQGGFRGDRRLIPLATARLSGFLLALPHRLAEPHGATELLVAASLGDPAVVEHHDLADLAGPIALVGDEQDGPAFGGLQQVRGERLARLWVKVGGGGLVADQQRRAGWQGAGRRRLCPISLCRSSLGSTAHGTALPRCAGTSACGVVPGVPLGQQPVRLLRPPG